jgi:hypothetical protein
MKGDERKLKANSPARYASEDAYHGMMVRLISANPHQAVDEAEPCRSYQYYLHPGSFRLGASVPVL